MAKPSSVFKLVDDLMVHIIFGDATKETDAAYVHATIRNKLRVKLLETIRLVRGEKNG